MSSWVTVPITGTYTDHNGVPLTGQITFAPPSPVYVDGICVVPATIVATVTAGLLSIVLPVTTDAGTQVYTVFEYLGGAFDRAPYTIQAVAGSPGVNLTGAGVGQTPVTYTAPATISLVQGNPGAPGSPGAPGAPGANGGISVATAQGIALVQSLIFGG